MSRLFWLDHHWMRPSKALASLARLIGISGLLYLICLYVMVAMPGVAKADTPLDYMIQEVCDNGSGGHTSADPITCPTTARKLKIGEALPYHKWDGTSPTTAQQISDSFPVAELSGRMRVVQSFFFDSQNSFINPVFDTATHLTGRSAYDLMLADGNYASYGGTYDGGRGWQPFWTTSGCSLADGWIIAPKTLTVPFSQGQGTSSLQNASPQCPSVTTFAQPYTVWNYYTGYSYETGKKLNTIKSWHFSGSNVNSSNIEEFMYTKEYGKTRWEAWSSTVSQPNANAVSRCPTGTSNGVSTYGSTTYYLTDCHDWSYVVASPNGDWDPSANWHVDPLYYSTNLLKNTHMECTSSANVASDCGAGGTCQTITPWNRTSGINWGYDQALQGQTASANCALEVNTPSTPNGYGIYQDVSSLPINTNYTFGTALWLPGSSSSASGAASVVVFQLNSSGGIVQQSTVNATVGYLPKYFSGSFTKQAGVTSLRFQVYINTQNLQYELTDSWVAPQP